MAAQNVQYDHYEHIIRTSKQWTEAGVKNWPVPRGVLCIEVFPDGLTKLKVGEGDKYYRQLPYVGGEGGDLSNYYTKEQVDRIITNLKAVSIPSTQIYPNKQSLPPTGNKLGDIRFVKNPGHTDPITYLWNDARWIELGGVFDVDLSEYVKRSEIMPMINTLERYSHTHANKAILDQTTHPYTREDKAKLDSLENYDDTEIKGDIADLESKVHTHANIDILDATTAYYTTEEKQKLSELHDYEEFIGTDGTTEGQSGLVPGPQPTDRDKFLASDGTWKTVSAGAIPPATTETIGGIIVGNNLTIDTHGVLSAVGGGGGGGHDYVAGDGIAITPGESTRDLTVLVWEQGGVNADGIDDNTMSYAIRSQFLENGLTDRIGVTASTTNSQNMYWKLFYYDSNHVYYAQTPDWSTSPTLKVTPQVARCKYIKIVLVINVSTPITPSVLGECNLSYPIEADKYVITNTGVTHLELDGKTIISVENGNTEDLIEFGDDLDVTNGVVNITDFNRLTLNVEE